MTDRVACAIRTLSKPDTVSAAENWADRDAAWPALAAQLRGTVGSASRATILATAALALRQVDLVIRAVGGTPGSHEPPATLDTTLELTADGYSLDFRRWSRHPECPC